MNNETPHPTQMDSSVSHSITEPDPTIGGAPPTGNQFTAQRRSDPPGTLLSSVSEPLLTILAPVFRQLSKASFGFALFCFFLPFLSVSCPGAEYSFSGTDLLVGSEVEGQRISGEALSWIALVCALTGLGLTFTRASGTLNLAAIFAGSGVFSLFALILKFSREVREQTEGLGQANANIGFFLCLFSFVAAGLLAGAAAKGTRRHHH